MCAPKFVSNLVEGGGGKRPRSAVVVGLAPSLLFPIKRQHSRRWSVCF